MEEAREALKSGFVAIVGRPNSGKSTLLNRLLGEKISIVADKPQTTRSIIRGIVTTKEGQVVFLDTPGVHRPVHRLNERMMKFVRDSISEADLLMLIVDASAPFGRGDEFTLEMVKPVSVPRFLLLNKIDVVQKSSLLPMIELYARRAAFDEVIPISALTGENVDTVLQQVFRRLPHGPMFFPPDQITDQPERSIAAEIIREKLIAATRDELPYSVAVAIERFEEDGGLCRIQASVYVERESQKRIIIGRGGRVLKEAGTAARIELESFFDRRIFLELHVKVRERWRNDEDMLRSLGI
jgi:GTP-binding protein Era